MKVSILKWSDIFNDYVESELPIDKIIDEMKDSTYALIPLCLTTIYGEEGGDKPVEFYVKIYK